MEHAHAFTNVTADSKRLKKGKKSNNNNNNNNKAYLHRTFGRTCVLILVKIMYKWWD